MTHTHTMTREAARAVLATARESIRGYKPADLDGLRIIQEIARHHRETDRDGILDKHWTDLGITAKHLLATAERLHLRQS